jgi:hypothetical protein
LQKFAICKMAFCKYLLQCRNNVLYVILIEALLKCLNLFVWSSRINVFFSYSNFHLNPRQSNFFFFFLGGVHQWKSRVKIFSGSALAGCLKKFFELGPNPLSAALFPVYDVLRECRVTCEPGETEKCHEEHCFKKTN